MTPQDRHEMTRSELDEAIALCTQHAFGCLALAKRDDGECDCPLRFLLSALLAEAPPPNERKCVDCGKPTGDDRYDICEACEAANPEIFKAEVPPPLEPGWQPIETLPDDVTFFVAAWECAGSETGYDVGEVYRDGDGFFALMGRLTDPPTHWHPLPSPPPITPKKP